MSKVLGMQPFALSGKTGRLRYTYTVVTALLSLCQLLHLIFCPPVNGFNLVLPSVYVVHLEKGKTSMPTIKHLSAMSRRSCIYLSAAGLAFRLFSSMYVSKLQELFKEIKETDSIFNLLSIQFDTGAVNTCAYLICSVCYCRSQFIVLCMRFNTDRSVLFISWV